ncbi:MULTISPECIES: MerR family transcriptional regulator [unclassified Paenibacillus]|uniref:MerR family transcriptional regulator n=1 Tax=Paenibacillus provencensis TaxID=441151 RepID=A0ABW3PZA8_9BACL|nr:MULTISPECIES: MerR family transcriptional regulator [unclassified Paenibacillus]MCM3127999.1 MerR family transcriptional regulator [Paenibacillus sp. MER 78]SFS81408.1 DNA-binding transcriptional regulator, MerR family [Paenibacillus sp. 453mf]
MLYKVKEVAKFTGVTIRTLHHYDEIGLVKPDEVTESGHRLYSDDNLKRLQQVLFFREIGFTLQEIGPILDRPDFDRRGALAAHKELLMEQKRRLEELIDTVDRTLQEENGGVPMSKEEMFNGFDMKSIEEHKAKYSQEAKEKYGEEIVTQTERKTDAYTEQDWARIHARNKEINDKIEGAMDLGPADAQVQEGVAELRQEITNNYYDCTPEIFRGLADLYVEDSRFTKNIEKGRTPGYAAFLREAMIIYCDGLK